MLSVAVVTPSLNQGRFIERTISSVLDQQYLNLEFVVCDGGSHDGTLGVLDRFADRLRAIVEPDGGQAAAVNKGIRLTSGEIVGWLNSDDLYRPGALTLVADYFERHPDVDVVYGQADVIDEHDQIIRRYPTEPWQRHRLAVRCFLAQPAVFFRRRVVERWGGLDEQLHFCMDYEYWLRIAERGASFAHVPRVFAASRTHTDTKTLRDRRAVHAELNAMLKQRLGSVPASWLINHAYTLTELTRASGKGTRVPFVAQMAVASLALSWQWNRSIQPALLADLARRIGGAATRAAPSMTSS